jgi:hypothetical protein
MTNNKSMGAVEKVLFNRKAHKVIEKNAKLKPKNQKQIHC